MHDAFNEIIDKLIESGMEEYDAIALVTRMMEEEALDFVFFDDLFQIEAYFLNSNRFIN